MEGDKRKPKRYWYDVRREVWDVQGSRSRRKHRNNGKASAGKQGEIGEPVGKYGGLREGMGMKTYLHGPTDFDCVLMTWTCQKEEVGTRCTSSREEEEVDGQMCPCGKVIE